MTPIVPAFDAGWDTANDLVNAWRGRAIQCFAQTEAAVSETLLVLATIPERGSGVGLRHLIGQRFQDLEKALGEQGPFAAEGAAASVALAGFRRHEPLRASLCHGIAKVTLDRRGQWLIVLRTLTFRGSAAERSEVVFEQSRAEAILAALKRDGQKLAATLGNLRASLRDDGQI